MNGIHEVRGSIPLVSTKFKKAGASVGRLFYARDSAIIKLR